LTLGLTELQALAQPAAGGKEWTGSNKKGYLMIFKVTGGVTSYDLYTVKNLIAPPGSCGTDNTANSQKSGPSIYQWDTWSIKTPIANNTIFVGNYPIPSNGVIFVDDHVWVEGTINNARVTVVSAIIGNNNPANNANITINNDLKYTNYDGRDSIGLIAQGNINAGMMSADNMRVDAALVAIKGRVGRYYYSSACTNYTRSSLTLYGMIASYLRYGFAYTDGTGYETRNIIYDGNLLYGPPPSFPKSSDQYQVISWQVLD
jgi:hypothetical protein